MNNRKLNFNKVSHSISQIARNVFLLLIFINFSSCYYDEPFDTDVIQVCPMSFSYKYLINKGAIHIPEDVLILGRGVEDTTIFYQLDDVRNVAVAYGFLIQVESKSNFIKELKRKEIYVSVTDISNNYEQISYTNACGYEFTCSVLKDSVITIQCITKI